MSKVLGIDLGTTITKMATIKNGQPQCLENNEGSVLTPSVVAISKSNERLVGILANRQAVTNPKNTVHSVKRFIGRKYSDPEVQAEIKRMSYETREADNGGVEVKLGDKWYAPVEISAMVLQKIKADAEAKLGEKISNVVITCPANFDDSQRKATKAAGEIAGFNVLKIINEPTAASLAYGLGKKKNQKVLIYDFGGGTFDVTILNVAPEVVEVIATGGEPHLGGNDFDQHIIDWLVKEFKKDQGLDLSVDPLALQRLKEAAEKAKIELSTAQETEINLPFISSDASGPKHLLYKLSRAKFEELTRDLIERSIKRAEATIQEAINKKDEPRLNNKSEIDEIVFVGGTTLIPAIRDAVKAAFGKEPNKTLNPEEVVALGAAVQAEIMTAAEEGRATEGDIKSVLLLDVLPLSLGIETLGEVNTIMIQKNTTIPTSKSQIFSTAADNQTSVEINVLQGERPMAKDNRSLGRFVLSGMPPAPRGLPQIEVTFDIDASGIITVSAKDKATNKAQSVKVDGSTGLSKEQIEKMKKEAELHQEEDKKKRELIKAHNQVDNMVYLAEKTLRDGKDKIPADLAKEVQEKADILKKEKETDNLESIKAKMEELSQAVQKAGASMYNAQQGEQKNNENAANENPSQGKEEPQEGQYREKRKE